MDYYKLPPSEQLKIRMKMLNEINVFNKLPKNFYKNKTLDDFQKRQ